MSPSATVRKNGKLKLTNNRKKLSVKKTDTLPVPEPVKKIVAKPVAKPVKTAIKKPEATNSLQPNSLTAVTSEIEKTEPENKTEIVENPQIETPQNPTIMEEKPTTETNIQNIEKITEKPVEKTVAEPKKPPRVAGEPPFVMPKEVDEIPAFKGETIERGSGINSTHTDNTQPSAQEPIIPEPDITPEPGKTIGVGTGGDNEPSENPVDPNNPVINDDSELCSETPMNDADKLRGAKAAASQVIGYYSALKPLAFEAIGKPNKKKIQKSIDAGELNPDVLIQMMDDTRKFHEYITEIDEKAKEVFIVSEEFKEEIEPPLTRIFLKRDVIMSDEATCISLVFKDLGMSVYQLILLKQATKQLIVAASDLSTQVKVNMKEANAEMEQLKRENADLKKRQAETYKKEKNAGVEDANVISSIKINPNEPINQNTADEGDDVSVLKKSEK